jgi:hypothetical protein
MLIKWGDMSGNRFACLTNMYRLPTEGVVPPQLFGNL